MKKSIKSTIIIIFLLITPIFLSAQNTIGQYDEKLAKELGADEYGMKSYVLVILKTGSNKTTDKKELDSLFGGHMRNMAVLSEAGKLIVAGPLGKNGNSYRGIFILNVKDTLEARNILSTDPAVNSKVLDADLYNWYGSAALPLYLEPHKKIQKSTIR
ncbi:MAG: hypothetical protein A2X19_02830 [Bacteroidetes bacterium GWE2_39_28]|nr:MAG: hypothetical protein A2X19_02830 [Bacteroidetes bacterium GWE2_39_28]OFZ07389.1 MAG: hypothetical protein A2322_05115 [Bacteroidetes bacterium RIFOXYB2_FULL_39_7]OFZ11909.1 MAG: hypothetical protein A2465_01695 [Bacteroidetes bacterium RIFOXYC2_FULL_39_11]HCT94381.1 hypothetical protein [Rikenellaceae bacterium]